MYQYTNPNPMGITTGDCVPRALSVLLGQSWEKTYVDLCLQGFLIGMMPSSNAVHISYLEQKGFKMYLLPSNCPKCITVREFSKLYPIDRYLLAMGDHVVALIDGDYYDSFDSGSEIVSYYFKKGE